MVNEIHLNINYEAIENFSIKFYLDDKSVIESSPIESAKKYSKFKIINPSKINFIRRYIPESISFKEEKILMDYQKPGIMGICRDLISHSENLESNKMKLPNINQSIAIMEWIKSIYED